MASVGSIVGGAFAVFRQRPVAVALWAATAIVGLLLLQFMLQALGVGPAALSGVGPGADPGAALARMSQMAGPLMLYFVLYLFLIIIVMNAVFRGMLRYGESDFGTLRVGADELRMLALYVVFFVALIILYIVAFLFFGILGFGLAFAAQSSAAASGIAIALMTIAIFCAAIWLYVRISLLFPLSFYRQNFIELDGAWRLTRGRFWTLFGSYLIVWVVMVILYVVLAWLSGGFAILGALTSGGSANDVQQIIAQRAQTPGIAIQLLSATIGAVVFILGFAVIASATRELLAADGESLEGDAERTAEIFE